MWKHFKDYVKEQLVRKAAGSTACTDTTQSGCTQQALSSGINWDISFKFLFSCVSLPIFLTGVETGKLLHILTKRLYLPWSLQWFTLQPLFHDFSLYLNSQWPHDVVWNRGINLDLGPSLFPASHLGSAYKGARPDQILASFLHMNSFPRGGSRVHGNVTWGEHGLWASRGWKHPKAWELTPRVNCIIHLYL